MNCVVESCCCCVPLQYGVLVLGYLRLFGGVLFFILASVGVSVYNYSTQTSAYLIMILLWTIAEAIYMISTALLIIVGVYHKKPAAIRAYFWISMVMLIWEAIFFLVLSILLANALFGVLNCFGFVIFAGVDIYFLFVFRSSYLAMQIEQLRKPGTVNHDPEHMMENFQDRPATSAFTRPDQLLVNINH